MKTKTVYVSLRIEYSYDESKTQEYDADNIASYLAVRPNYISEIEGVQLHYVEICGMGPA